MHGVVAAPYRSSSWPGTSPTSRWTPSSGSCRTTRPRGSTFLPGAGCATTTMSVSAPPTTPRRTSCAAATDGSGGEVTLDLARGNVAVRGLEAGQERRRLQVVLLRADGLDDVR